MSPLRRFSSISPLKCICGVTISTFCRSSGTVSRTMSVSRTAASIGAFTSTSCRAAASRFLIFTPSRLMVSASSARNSSYSSMVSRSALASRAIVAESVRIRFTSESRAVLFMRKRSRSSVRRIVHRCCNQRMPPSSSTVIRSVLSSLFICHGFFGNEPDKLIHVGLFQQNQPALVFPVFTGQVLHDQPSPAGQSAKLHAGKFRRSDDFHISILCHNRQFKNRVIYAGSGISAAPGCRPGSRAGHSAPC